MPIITDFILLKTLGEMCEHYQVQGNCSDCCPVWELTGGDCFPSVLKDKYYPIMDRVVAWKQSGNS